MAPIVHGLESEWKTQVEFLFVNVGDSSTVPARRKLGFTTTPHFFFLSATGEIQRVMQGVVPRESLEVALRALSP